MYVFTRLDGVFGALSNPTRRAILNRLADGTHTVLELAGQFEMSQPAITKHLNILEQVGLIQRRKEGRYRHCSLTPNALDEPNLWIEQLQAHWEQRLDALEKYLEEEEEV
jgi:DNA-binding transcriptional ArsR family regulator